MTAFDERERAFEERYRRDEELQFRIRNRRNRLLGLWAAEFMGLNGNAAEAYAAAVVAADFEAPGDDDIIRMIASDVALKGLEITEDRLRRRVDRLFAIARDQIREVGGPVAG